VRTNGFSELARRYALNLTNGRFLWRNRIGAEQVEVRVARLKEGRSVDSWTFDALAFPLRDMVEPPASAGASSGLASAIESGLAGDSHVLLQVTAFARVGAGQEVFPSQELILEDRERGKKSRTLYDVAGTAAIHSQKIGNALRTIDTWYPGADENGPIAVEPYGSVTTQGKAWRQPKAKMDFYTLLDGWIVDGKVPDPEQQHFVIATLIRGGVFGKAD
jgi:CRISPR-associated protein Csy3